MTTKRIFRWLLLLGLACSAPVALAEDGYDLWLRYRPVPAEWLEAYHRRTSEIIPGAHSPTLDVAQAELSRKSPTCE
jgi:alpha-glucuronidase